MTPGSPSEPVAFPALREAMWQWVSDAVDALNSGPEPELVRDWGRWQRDEDGVFRHAEREVRVWNRDAEEAAMQLPSWRVVDETFHQDVRLREQVDTLVGTSRGRSRFETYVAGRRTLPRPDEVGDLEEAFARRYKLLDAYLAAEEFEFLEVWAVPGLSSSEFPIALEADLELDWMSDVELATSLAGNLITRTVPLDWPVLTPQEFQQACMRFRYCLPKVVGDDDQPDPLTSFHQREKREQGFTAIQEVLEQALALLFADAVAITGRLSLESDRVLSSGVSYPPLVLTRSRPLRRLDLDASTVAELTKVWNQLRRPKLHKAIKVAVRRLAYQAGRERVEDEIVDILVAAEALYLSGRDGPTELGFRLALRAAALADPRNVGMSRRDVYGTMKNAYGVRSKIVHGDQPRPTDLKVRGVPVSLQAFVQAIEDIVRPALRDAVERAADPKLTWPPNWDDLTVPM